MNVSFNKVRRWGFKNYDIPFVMEIVEIGNYLSQRVVESIGLKRIERRYILNLGEDKEKEFYYYRINNDK